MGIVEKISDIENEIKRTQKNKGTVKKTCFFYCKNWTKAFFFCRIATEYHLGLLKAKLARYRVQLLEGAKTKSEKVMKDYKDVSVCSCAQ